MKRISLFILALFLTIGTKAQQKEDFNPAKFEADLEQFVIEEASLSQKETAAFLPIWRELRGKQIELIKSGKSFRNCNMNDEKQCAEAIKKHDDQDVKLKELQRNYHNKFLKVLPASKVLRVIRAEDRFHRQAFKHAMNKKKAQ